MGKITVNDIPTNEELFELAVAEGSPAQSIFSKYDSYQDFATKVAGLSTEDAMKEKNALLDIALAWFDENFETEDAGDILEEQGVGTKVGMSYCGMMRNLYIKTPEPIDPAYKDNRDGVVLSPAVQRKFKVAELFFTTNSDYQNAVTIDEIESKRSFQGPTGISELAAGVRRGLNNKRIEWGYQKKLETLNLLINDSNLKDNQKIEVNMNSYSVAELQNLSNVIDNVVSAMTINSTGAFNMNSWKVRPKKDDLVILMKPIIDNASKNYVTPYAFNDVILKNGIKKVYIENYGGLIPTVDGTEDTELKPIHDDLGSPVGLYSENGLASDATQYTEDEVQWYDPNEDVLAVIMDKNIMKEIFQDGRVIEPFYNVRTRKTTLWDSDPNLGFIYDRQKDVVIIKKKISEPVVEPSVSVSLPSTAEQGETITGTVTLTNCSGAETAILKCSDNVVASSSLADDDGEQAVSFQIPQAFTAGSYTATVTIFGSTEPIVTSDGFAFEVTEPAVEPSIEVSVSPVSHTLDPNTATEEVNLTLAVNFAGLDTSEDIEISIDDVPLPSHTLTAEEITAGSFTEVVAYECNGSDPGEKTITVTGTQPDSQTIVATTEFTVIVEQAKSKN